MAAHRRGTSARHCCGDSLFANEIGFYKWWRFSRWFLPISLAAIIFLSNTFSLPLSGLVAPETFVWLFGVVYAISTFVIVLRGFFIARHADG